MNMEFVAVARPDEDGVLTITVPGWPGCISQAQTKAQVAERAQEALEAIIIGSMEDGGLPNRNNEVAPSRAPRGGMLTPVRVPTALAVALQVRMARVAANLTQAALAKRVGVNQRQIAKWESGNENVSVDAIDRVAAALGMRVHVSLVAA